MVLVNLRIDAEALDAGDVCIVAFTDVIAHELHHLVLDGIAFRILCNEFHVRAMLAQLLIMLLVGRPSALLITGYQAVDHRVGIAADRRGEVGVIVKGQPEVSDVVRGVLRFHHRTERDHLYHFRLTLALYLVHQLVQRTGSSSLGAG